MIGAIDMKILHNLLIFANRTTLTKSNLFVSVGVDCIYARLLQLVTSGCIVFIRYSSFVLLAFYWSKRWN